MLAGLLAIGAGVILLPFAGVATLAVGMATVVLVVTARLMRMVGNVREGSSALAVTSVVVAAAYEAGRALALVAPAGHGSRRASARLGRQA